ncbi:MAG TPA: hypothetical protein VN253_00375 [Kofleriaceae bacterium]|nr:hypothetical protein [Kofleriaceae bacterium]
MQHHRERRRVDRDRRGGRRASKDAANREGCESIPYGDLRSNCRSQQSDVHPWCDGDRGPVSCDSGGTRDLRAKLEKEQRNLETLKDKRRDFEDKRSRAADDGEKTKWTMEIEAVDRDIEASKKRIDDLKADLDKRKDFVEKAIYTLNKCIDYRRAVMNIFAYATDKVRGENEPDIKPYAEKLRDKYPQHISGHEIQITSRMNALENCKKEQP